MKKQRICFIVETFYPISAGVGNSTFSLSKSLAIMGHDVSVITPKLSPDSPAEEKISGFTIYRPGIALQPNFSSVKTYLYYMRFILGTLTLLLYRLKPDAILGQTAWTGGFLASLAGFFRPRCLSMVHTHGEPKLCNKIHALARFAYRHCRVTLATNRTFARQAQAWGAPGPIYLCGNIVEDTLFKFKTSKHFVREQLGYAEDIFHIVCVARLVYEHGVETKGISYAINAMRHIPNAQLHIFGDGNSRHEFEALAKDQGVADRVIFHGAVDRMPLYNALYAANTLLMPSLSEGLSMTMIEAMMLSTPVVITRTSGALDYVQDNENGLLIEIASSDAIADAILRLQANPLFTKKLGANGRKSYEQYFSTKKVTQSFLKAMDGTGETA